jgi:hypothetical protein
MITTNEREPLKDLSSLGKQEQRASASQALSPNDFKSAIRRAVQNQPATK